MPEKKWSKVKKKIESFICDSLKDKVQFRVTNYRKAHDQTGRVFITVDKKEVFSMSTLAADNAMYEVEQEIMTQQNIDYDVYNGPQNVDIQSQAHEMIMAEGVFSQSDFFDAVEEYLSSSIEVSLKSNHIIIKILSLIDRRVGKRSLKKMAKSIEQEKEIVQYFYHLRCEAEGLENMCKKI
ncbi:hypothetical protein [Desemzia sp. FAM 23991]|uniref:SF0329 family protein n=1 Tax=unclassified Desemzia TaxID=2685243 RepID=UPI0038861EC7